MPVHLSATNTPAVDKSIREDEQGKEEEEEKKGLQLVYFANKGAPIRIFFSWKAVPADQPITSQDVLLIQATGLFAACY